MRSPEIPATVESVRPVRESDRGWIAAVIAERWSGAFVVARGAIHYPERLPGFIAEDAGGRAVGLATYARDGETCDLVTLDALLPRRGIGSRLLDAVAAAAAAAGCTKLRLVTTNDNAGALAFYRSRGLRVVCVRRDAIALARALKPSIPLTGANGVPIRDEIELELPLNR